jgi:hypothetical protein
MQLAELTVCKFLATEFMIGQSHSSEWDYMQLLENCNKHFKGFNYWQS